MLPCEELELYALDALPEDEQRFFEEHLGECSSCSRELPSLWDTATLLALSVPAVKPPARLKMHVLSATAEARQEVPATKPAHPRWRRGLLATVATSSIAASFALGFALSTPDGPARPSVEQQQIGASGRTVPAPATVLDEIMASEDSTTMSKKLEGGMAVSVAYSPQLNKGVFSAKNMAELSDREVYQLWLQNGKGELVPAGAFAGSGDNLLAIEGDLVTAQAIGLTVEPHRGMTAPSTTPLVLMDL